MAKITENSEVTITVQGQTKEECVYAFVEEYYRPQIDYLYNEIHDLKQELNYKEARLKQGHPQLSKIDLIKILRMFGKEVLDRENGFKYIKTENADLRNPDGSPRLLTIKHFTEALKQFGGYK